MAKNSDLFDQISDQLGLSKTLVEIIITHQFRFLKAEMQSPELPSILLHNLGTFRPRKGRVEFLIKKLIHKCRAEQDQAKKLELKEKIKYLWEVRKTTYK
jgi:hypothetical protein